MRRTASALCLCLALCSLPTISEAVPPIPGDIDLDGDVDFTDFLIFVLNYGKVGPVPTVEYGRVDTVYVPLELPPAVYRAVELLGFWTFNNFDFVMGDIEAEPGNDGEYFVLGTSSSGVLVGGKYSPLVGQYFLTYLGPVWDYSFSFDIYETGQVVGEILRSPANNGILESYSPLVSGGRGIGNSWKNYASKSASTTTDSTAVKELMEKHHRAVEYIIAQQETP